VLKDGDAVLLPVRIQGKEYAFMLDTGFTGSAFDTSLSLGTSIGARSLHTPSGMTQLNFYKPPAAQVGPFSFDFKYAVAGMDFSDIRRASGHPIFGIIGMDFLTGRVLEIDFDKGELRFVRAAAEDAGPRIPLSFGDSKRPHVAIQTLGRSHDFLVDTGYVGGTGWLDQPVFDEAVRSRKLKIACNEWSIDASGERSSRYAQGIDLSVGEFIVAQPYLGEGNGNALGLEFFSRFVVTFDFSKHQMHLKKGKNFNRPDYRNRSGTRLIRDEDGIYVYSVEKGSPGERVGLMADDQILSISGRKTAELRLFEITRLLAIPRETIQLVIRRENRDYQAMLKLQD
jgi:hypothetical protein